MISILYVCQRTERNVKFLYNLCERKYINYKIFNLSLIHFKIITQFECFQDIENLLEYFCSIPRFKGIFRERHNEFSTEFEELLWSSSGTQKPHATESLVFISLVKGGIRCRGIRNVERLNKSKKTLYLSLKKKQTIDNQV